GIRILQEAKSLNMKTMIGCMVETSLGIFSALAIANGVDYIDLDGFFIIEDEPYGLIKEEKGLLEKRKLL
ncbi:MAG: dipeptide epimerase, partial [Cytophagaceae bacterium]